jgi:large subunit ribosomal protein L19
LNNRAVEASQKERPVPDIRTGDIVEIKLVNEFLIIFFIN